ncbi:hypothetical protein BKA56DRAFT_610391 [Ilyonectria sp. MPI-CAGE-AT-0026]|nr:hypothetical protein BKA56DRAFT_610391 [Ilyonectria sp. MPI-CAGE-AT-0026]
MAIPCSSLHCRVLLLQLQLPCIFRICAAGEWRASEARGPRSNEGPLEKKQEQGTAGSTARTVVLLVGRPAGPFITTSSLAHYVGTWENAGAHQIMMPAGSGLPRTSLYRGGETGNEAPSFAERLPLAGRLTEDWIPELMMEGRRWAATGQASLQGSQGSQGSQTVEVDQGTNTDCRVANNAIVQQASSKATENASRCVARREGGWLDASRHSIRQVEIALQVESARGGVDVQRKGSQEAKKPRSQGGPKRRPEADQRQAKTSLRR